MNHIFENHRECKIHDIECSLNATILSLHTHAHRFFAVLLPWISEWPNTFFKSSGKSAQKPYHNVGSWWHWYFCRLHSFISISVYRILKFAWAPCKRFYHLCGVRVLCLVVTKLSQFSHSHVFIMCGHGGGLTKLRTNARTVKMVLWTYSNCHRFVVALSLWM